MHIFSNYKNELYLKKKTNMQGKEYIKAEEILQTTGK
jgi:hypothetical protein